MSLAIRARHAFARRRAAIVLAAAALVLPLLIATPAFASGPVYREWTLSGVTFNDGGTLSGTLAIASDGSLARADLTTAGGAAGIFGTHNYNTDTDPWGQSYSGGVPIGWSIFFPNYSQALFMALPDTTSAQKGDSLSFAVDTYECINCSPYRYVTAGNIVAGGAAGAATTVDLSSDHNPAGPRSAVTFTATVSSGGGTPSGQVTFRDLTTSTDLCSGVTLDGSGGATCSVSASDLGLGSHAIRASFAATPSFQASADRIGELIAKAATSVSLASSPQSSTYRQLVHLVATVSTTATGLGSPTGTVDFLYNGSPLCSGKPLDWAGKAACDLRDGIAIGPNLVIARYSGDANYTPDTSPVHVHETGPAVTSTTVALSRPAVDRGQRVQLIASVDTAIRTRAGTHPLSGKVQFTVDGRKLTPQVGLVNGHATLTINATLTPGSHHVRAFYVSNAYYVASSSPAMLLFVK